MKKSLLILSMIAGTFSALAQRQSVVQPASSELLNSTAKESPSLNPVKSLLCLDTIRYPQIKEQLLYTDPVEATFYKFSLYKDDNESISQMFTVSGSGLSIRGIEVFGANNIAGNVTIRGRVFNVDAQNNPTGTALATANVVANGTTANYYRAMFASPITVTANYAVVIDVITNGGIFDIFVNDVVPGQPYDENLSRYKSSYYPNSNGNYISIPVLTTGDVLNWPNGTYDFEPIVAPLVSYTINTTATATPDPTCFGQAINFSGSATPAALMSNRMYNFNVFSTYFLGAASDSTYAWDYDNLSPISWSSTSTYTYPAAGVYDATMYTLGGFWHSCLDFATDQVTVTALPTVTAGASSTTICQGASVSLSQGNANTYSWDNGIGAVTSPTVTPAITTTYTVTGTITGGCTNTAQVTVNVTPIDNASFSYPSNTICTTSGNAIPTTNTAGTFSSTAGLVFANTTTGEINVSASTGGTYTVTYTTNGSCPNSDVQSINITDAPDASFTYSDVNFCTGTANPMPLFGSGSAGTFSSTTGLVFSNVSTGEVNLATSTPGNYVITNTIAANGACPQVAETFNLAISETPTATISGGGSACGDGSTPIAVNIAMTGSGPWDIYYSDGTTISGTNAQATSPLVINASQNGTYTIVSVATGSCTSSGTGSASVVFNPNPIVSIDPINSVCDNVGLLVTLTASPAGGSFTGTGVTGNQFDPAQIPGSYAISYAYTDGNSCSGSASTNVEVLASPIVTFGPINDLCLQDGAISIGGVSPAGGTFSGTGVTGSQFDPIVSGVGSYSITYTVSANGCTSTASQSITVNDCAGIEEMSGIELTVAPNPATDVVVLTLNSNNGDQLFFSLLSEDGKMILAPTALNLGTKSIDVNSLASGVYFVSIESANGRLVKKLIIQ